MGVWYVVVVVVVVLHSGCCGGVDGFCKGGICDCHRRAIVR